MNNLNSVRFVLPFFVPCRKKNTNMECGSAYTISLKAKTKGTSEEIDKNVNKQF